MVTLDQRESSVLQSEWGSCAQYVWAAVDTAAVVGTAAAVVCIVASSVVASAVDIAAVVSVVVAGTSAAVD